MIHSLSYMLLLAVFFRLLFFVCHNPCTKKGKEQETARKRKKKPEIFPRFFFFTSCHLNVRKNPIIDSYRQHQHVVASLIANIIVTNYRISVR